MDTSSSIAVVVRVRPFSEKERLVLSNQSSSPALFVAEGPSSFLTPQPPPPVASSTGNGVVRKILKVLDDRIIIFDPDESNALAAFQRKNLPPKFGKKVKDIRFCFDRVFDEACGQQEVYDGSAKALVDHVMNGFNSTVFAYGATGCGKTHTISGTPSDPGVIFLIMKDLFARITAKAEDTDFTLSISYLEIYNEQIRDLLAPENGQLALRESQGNAEVAGLSTKAPTCAQDVVEWITIGNANRTVNATEANATSSRSHAVLQISIKQRPRGSGLTDTESMACLSVIDLAGSERAAVTKNKGERLLEGANINRSLLALGNCIHALCDPKTRNHVPFRDSKLTRLLKPSLGGNCRTVMIVCVSPSSQHYDETHNTLQYANRAKEIKTKAVRNVISVDRHVAQYCQQIMEQTQVIDQLRAELKSRKDSANGAALDEDVRACEAAKRKLLTLAETDRVVRAAQAKVELQVIDHVRETLLVWREAAFDESFEDDLATDALATMNGVLRGLDTRSMKLRDDVMAAEGAMTAFRTHRASMTSEFHSKPLLARLFALEMQALDADLGAKTAAGREAAARAAPQIQAQAVFAIVEAKSKVTAALVAAMTDATARQRLVSVDQRLSSASQTAFTRLCGQLPAPVFGESLSAVNALSTNALKRSAAPSNADIFGNSSARKAARASVAPSPQPRPVAMFAKRSPKKSVVFNSVKPKSPLKRKSKSVAWRDEATEDGMLEDVKPDSPSFSTDSSCDAVSTPDIMLTAPPAALAPSSTPWASFAPSPLANVTNTASVASAAERMSNLLKQRSAAQKPLRPLHAARPSAVLPAVQEGVSFSLLKQDPFHAAGDSSIDLANTSTSSAESSSARMPRTSASRSSGSIAPPPRPSLAASSALTPRKAARRASSIGPLRSVKTTRRISLTSNTSADPARFKPRSSIAPPPPSSSAHPVSRYIGPTATSLSAAAAPGVKKRASFAPTPLSGTVPGSSISIFSGGGAAAQRAAARRASAMPGSFAALPTVNEPANVDAMDV